MQKARQRSGRVIVPVIVVLLLGTVIFLSVRNWQRQQHAGEDLLIVSGTVEARYTRIASLSGGRLSELHVQEGQTIQAGEAIAATDPLDLPQQIDRAQAAVGEAQASLALLQAGATPEELASARHRAEAAESALASLQSGSRTEEIAAAENRVAIAGTQLADANDEVGRLEQLYASGVVEERRIVEARARVTQLKEALRIAGHNLELLRNGPREEDIEQLRQQAAASRSDYERVRRGARPEELTAASARVSQLEAAVAALQRNLQESSLSAPAAGEIVSVPVTLGDTLSPGETICELLLPESIYIQTFVPEDRLAWLQLGDTLEYELDGVSGLQQASVSFISPTAEFTPRNLQTTEKRSAQVFRIKLTPLPGSALRPGEICDIRIPAPEARRGTDG